MQTGVGVLAPHLEDLGERLRSIAREGRAPTEEQLDRVLDEWVEAHRGDTDLGSMITRPLLMADLAGQIMVAQYETHRVGNKEMSFRDEPAAAFLDATFTDAIEQYERMQIPRDREFSRLIEEYSGRSGAAADLVLKRLRKVSRDQIIAALNQGTDYASYVSDLTELVNSLGVGPEHPSYLENVFRTNTFTAYGAGRYRQLTDPDIQDEYAYVQYRTIGDARVRESHRVLNGLIFRADDKRFAEIWPPNGYMCRCSVASYKPKAGDKIAARVPRKYEPDADFNRAPDALIQL